MCGIAVKISTQDQVVPLDLNLLSHRGPDARGEWASRDRRLWMGHTRLSILDLTPTGAQPMVDPSTGNVLVFNGEIYNHLKLREMLAGENWKGSSDTETILVGYRRWGQSVFDRLIGMFALAIYDASRGKVIFARDREGIKPLYWRHANSGEWIFASEWRALYGKARADVRYEEIASYLRFGAFPEEILPASAKSVRAGQILELSLSGEMNEGSIEDFSEREDPITTAEEAVIEVRKVVEDSIHRHLLSDVPIASFLSGGLDSSIVALIAARHHPKKLKTISMVFPGEELDESHYSRQVAKLAGSDHLELKLNDDDVVQGIVKGVAAMDLPTIDGLNTFLVCDKAATLGIRVALSGLGADEMFGGYPIFTQMRWLKRLRSFPMHLPMGSSWWARRLLDLPRRGRASLVFWKRYKWTSQMLKSIGMPMLKERFIESQLDDFHLISEVDREVYTRPMLLRDSDQMSMAVSLELRVPFLDREVCRLCSRITGDAFNQGGIHKGILIKAFEDVVPREVYRRPKKGFVLPMGEWMRGPLKNCYDEGIEIAVDLLKIPAPVMKELQDNHERGRNPWTVLWSLVVLGHWIRKNKVSVIADA